MKINFYNNCNNGDVHFSRKIISVVKEIYPDAEFYFLHRNRKGLLKDLKFITEGNLNDKCVQNNGVTKYENEIYINTWYGQQNLIFMIKGGGTTLMTVNYILQDIMLNLGKIIDFPEETIYPSVDFNNIDLPLINNGFNVLICNNESLSGQANNVNLDYMIDVVSSLYPNITFYITKKIAIYKPNVIFTSDITNVLPDLLEISYISTKCNIIVGRSSGPYSFSMLLENIKDENKTLIGLCNNSIDGIWDTRFLKCRYVHNPSGDINVITNNLIDIIKTYGK
jgi:hypothetical protein